jgi:hypothetical protein
VRTTYWCRAQLFRLRDGGNPSSFAWRETDGRFVLRVRFKAAEEAVVFAVHFVGTCLDTGVMDVTRGSAATTMQ